MQEQYRKTNEAIKNAANVQMAVALHTVIIGLGVRKLAVSDGLAGLTGNELLSSRGRALVNREQELHIAQKVLCELLVKEHRGRGRQQQCMSAARAALAPVLHPHHCTARSADGACEECEGHAQAMREWKAEQEAAATLSDMAAQPRGAA